MDYRNVFKRYELKYLISGEEKAKILSAMEPFMKEDAYGRSTLRNLYYDTPDYALIRRSLEGPIYKEKLRIRRYGEGGDDTVFLELKKKYKGVVYKRRVAAGTKEALAYMAGEAALSHKGQITEELDYFKAFYKPLEPKMLISYEREAYFGTDDENLRITFDENLLWEESDFSKEALLGNGMNGGIPILRQNQILMEVKVSDAMPLWLAQVLSKEGLFKTSFSKYGAAYLQKRKGVGNGLFV